MIINLLINFIILILAGIFSWLPIVSSLPAIAGYDLDQALVDGVGMLNSFLNAFWPIKIMFQGFLVILGYYSIKLIVKFFLGHRTPSH